MNINSTPSAGVQPSDQVDPFADYSDWSDEEIQDAFFSTIQNGNVGEFKKLLDHPAIHADIRNADGQNMVLAAVAEGQEDIALQLIDMFRNTDSLDLVDEFGYTAVIHACQSANVKVLKALLDAGATVNVPLAAQQAASVYPFKGPIESALMQAVDFIARGTEFNRDSSIQQGKQFAALLIEAGADVSDALMRAVGFGREDTARILINEYKADPLRALELAQEPKLHPDTIEAIKFLVKDSAPPPHNNDSAVDNPLNAQAFEEIARQAAAPHAQPVIGANGRELTDAEALTFFSKKGDAEKEELLLESVVRNKHIGPALKQAIEHEQMGLAEKLLDVDQSGAAEELLASNVAEGNRSLVYRLIDQGVSVSGALMHAVTSGARHVESVLKLLGADYVSALLFAAQRGYTEAARNLFETRGINMDEAIGRTREEGREDVVPFLVDVQKESMAAQTVNKA